MITTTYTFTTVFNQPVVTDDVANPSVDIFRVVIPGIQRAYAHGRTSRKETKIRNAILDTIFECLTSPTYVEKDFHFIYGAVAVGDDGKLQLELLDGQQRFTTLFLLHWYLMNCEHVCLDSFRSKAIENALKSFYYKTRTSSTEFCKSLATYRCELKGTTPSVAIKNARWYYNRFDNDSTIQGMLVMLDAIHERYEEPKYHDPGQRLIYRTERLKFYVLPLMDYKMSEELYIKMNARGLPLTAFDNFKSEFIGVMKSVEDLNKTTVTLPDGSPASHQERISVYLDSKWIDLFWTPSRTDYDVHYMRFFSRFFAYRYIVDSVGIKSAEQIQKDTSLPINVFYTQSEDKDNRSEYLGFEKYGEVLKEHSEYFEKIEKVLDTLHVSNNMSVILDSLTPVWDSGAKRQENFFVDADVPFSQSLLVVFGAICEFILAFDSFNSDTFNKWMRVVWNVVENTNIDSLRAATGPLRNMSRVVNEIAGAMGKGSCFNNYAETNDGDLDFFNALSCVQPPFEQRAITEEIRKARRIALDGAWLDAFIDAEQHPYLKGAVGFFYDQGLSLKQFIHNRDLVKTMFDKDGIAPEYRERHLLIRAIFSNLKTWDGNGPQYNLQDHYITEDSETNKRLKLLLLGNEDIRLMFVNTLYKSTDAASIKRELNATIIANRMPFYSSPEQYWDNKFVLIHNALCNDVLLYDWMAQQSSVYAKDYYGHYVVTVPGAWYDRFMVDSERDKMALSLMPPSSLGMSYYGDYACHATQKHFDTYHRFLGTEICLYRKLDINGDFIFWVVFLEGHQMRVYVECGSLQRCRELNERIDAQGLSFKTKIQENKTEILLYLDVDESGEPSSDFRYLMKDEFERKLKGEIYKRFAAVERAINKK